MATYRNISTNFWSDPKVDDYFTPEDKYFYLYLLTNPHTNICGCYEIGVKQMERETGYTWETLERLLDRFQNVHNVIRWHAESREVLLLHWGRYNWSKSEKVKRAVQSVAQHIKHEPFRQFIELSIENQVPDIPDAEQIADSRNRLQKQITEADTDVSIGYRYPMDTVSHAADAVPIRPSVDYQSILDDYNQTCTRLSKVTKLSDARRKAIAARLKNYTVEELHKAFQMANSSNFLCGCNQRDWSASFDWLMKDANLAKVLDGNYGNSGKEVEDNGKSDYYARVFSDPEHNL